MSTGLRQQAEAWLRAFEACMAARDAAAFDALFLDPSYWRDLVAYTWDTCQFWGRDQVRAAMFAHAPAARPCNFGIDPERTAPRLVRGVEGELLEVFFSFDTAVGRAKGVAKLRAEAAAPHAYRALQFATLRVALDCAPERFVDSRHPRLGFDPEYPGQTWSEYRAAKARFADCDPDVLIIGGGHSGLCIGARLERMGVSYLIVDKLERPGDGWRQRYECLALHTVTAVNDLPYLRMPAGFPMYLAKDKWADWLESYARTMELNFWGSTEFVGGSFDEAAGVWTATLRLADGVTRVMHPKHVVMAVGGIGGRPNIPELPGLKDFAGTVQHSAWFKTGAAHAGQRVLVVGTSTSAHDIALDLVQRGAASVTMAQRGPACVVNISDAERLNTDYLQGTMSPDEGDQRRTCNQIYPLTVERLKAHTVITDREHAGLFAGLEKAGMRLTTGPDRTGWIMKLFRDLAGYYLNVGCSEAIVAGRIGVIQSAEIERYVAAGARMQDGSVREFDTIILATGFQNLRTEVEALFGPDIADRVGPSIGLGVDGEPRNLCRPTGQPHLWLIFGGIIDGRRFSQTLAFQIVGQMRGLTPTLVRQPDGGVRPLPAAAPA